MNIEELAARVSPAGGLVQPASRAGLLVKPVEAGVTIHLQHAGERRQMQERALVLPARRREEHLERLTERARIAWAGVGRDGSFASAR